MIEAVNMSVATSSLNRSATVQAPPPAVEVSAAPAEISAGVSAPYLSPHVNLVGFRKPIFIIRDSETGEHVRQFPTESQIRAYNRAADVRSQQSAAAAQSEYQVQQYQADQANRQAYVENSVQYRQARAEVKQVEVKVEQPKPQPAPTGGSSSAESSSSSQPVQSSFSTEA